MIPISFDGCAAWLHDAKGGPGSGRGAVLLAPHGFEELCARPALRVLADGLARRGVPCLRFDYHGTGDSTGSDTDPDRIAVWIGNAEAAIDRLIALTGVDEVALIGLRLGALLAPSVAGRRPEVTRLGLLAPPASGASYLREMRALSLMLGAPAERMPQDKPLGDLVIAGYRLTAETAAALKPLDPAALDAAPASTVLILAPETARGSGKLAEPWRALGARVEEQAFPGYQEMMCDPTASQVPLAALDGLADWAADHAPAARGAHPAILPMRLDETDWSEKGVLLAGGAAGIYCRPAGQDPRQAVLMLNAGGIHHTGWARMNVEMARRLARAGVASLRLDFPGIGDAAPWTSPKRLTFYDVGTDRHVQAGLDWLAGQGATSLTIAGTCSGAHHGFHTAIGDERVRGLVMLNTLCFIWGPGYALPLNAWKLTRPKEMASRQRRIEGEAGQPTLVERVIDTSLPLLKETVRSLMEALKTGLAPLARLRTDGAARGEVEGWFQALSRRGTRVALVYGEDDLGRTELERHMGPDGSWASALPGISIDLIADTDHALTPDAARQRYSDILLAFCTAESVPAETAPRRAPRAAAG